MFWTSWSVCDGSKCPTGKQQRLKGVCCPKVGNRTLQETKENCKKDCNLTDADFQEQSPYVPPPTTAATTTIATTTLIVSSTTAKPLTSTKGTYMYMHCGLLYPTGSASGGVKLYMFWPVRQSVSLVGVFSHQHNFTVADSQNVIKLCSLVHYVLMCTFKGSSDAFISGNFAHLILIYFLSSLNVHVVMKRISAFLNRYV